MANIRWRDSVAYLLAAGVVGCAAATAYVLGSLLDGPPRSMFIAAVVLCAYLWGKRVAIASALFAAIARYIVIDHGGISLEDLGAAIVFLVVGYVVASLISKIREQRELLAVTPQSIGDAVLVTDGDGRVTYVNPVAEVLTEWRLEDARGRPFSMVCELANEATGQPVDNPIARALAEGRIVGLANHTALISRYKRVFPIEDSAAPIKGKDGAVLGAVMVFHDVSTARRTAREIRLRELEYRTLFELSAAGKAEEDLHSGRFLRVNQKFCEMTGYSEEELLERTFLDLTHPDDLEEDSALWQRAIRGEKREWSTEKRYVRKDGSMMWVHVARSTFELDASGARVIAVAHDITELKQQETMLERLVAERTEKLQQSMQSMEEMCYSLAHDLRGPLRAIAGFTSTLLQEPVPNAGVAKDLRKRIGSSVNRMDRIISDILQYGLLAHTTVALERVSLDDEMDAVLDGLRSDLENRKAEVVVQRPLGEVTGNKALLHQVLENLVSNAVKFVAKWNYPRVAIRSESRGAWVRLWVEDSGVGIEPEYADRVFNLFQRLHPAEFPGTGVGLALVRKGMEKMEVKAGFESEPGYGSRFWVEFKAGEVRP